MGKCCTYGRWTHAAADITCTALAGTLKVLRKVYCFPTATEQWMVFTAKFSGRFLPLATLKTTGTVPRLYTCISQTKKRALVGIGCRIPT